MNGLQYSAHGKCQQPQRRDEQINESEPDPRDGVIGRTLVGTLVDPVGKCRGHHVPVVADMRDLTHREPCPHGHRQGEAGDKYDAEFVCAHWAGEGPPRLAGLQT